MKQQAIKYLAFDVIEPFNEAVILHAHRYDQFDRFFVELICHVAALFRIAVFAQLVIHLFVLQKVETLPKIGIVNCPPPFVCLLS